MPGSPSLTGFFIFLAMISVMYRLVMHRVMMMHRFVVDRLVMLLTMMRIMMVLRHRHAGKTDKSQGD